MHGTGSSLRRGCFTAALIALSAGLLAQSPSSPARQAGQQPVFKAGVNYVEVDASVTDKDGAFVDGLTKSDFSLFEDGKRQEISVFSRVDLPVERRVSVDVGAKAPVPADAAANPPFKGRVFALVLDEQQTGFAETRRVRAAARDFVTHFLGANDVVAIVGTGGTVGQTFTPDSARALHAIDRFMGQQGESAAAAAEEDAAINLGLKLADADTDANSSGAFYLKRNEGRVTLRTLKALADYLARIPDRRKAVVLFGGGIQAVTEDRDLQELLQKTIEAADRANVGIYGVDVRGQAQAGTPVQLNAPGSASSLRDEFQSGQEGVRVLSKETGGFAVVNANDLAPSLSRIVQENSRYYVLGYYPKGDARDGKFHAISVKVARPGLTVDARKGYVAANDKKPAVPESVGRASAALAAALANPLPVSDIGLRVSAAPFRAAGSGASLSVTLEVDASRFMFEQANGAYVDRLELAVLSADAKGKVQIDQDDSIDLSLRGNYDAVRERGIRIGDRVDVQPGRYHLLVGVREANGGLIGTVPLDVDVPDFSRGDLAVSGILIASAAAGRIPTTRADLTLRDVLPAPPTSTRDFPRGDTLSIFAEAYDATPSSQGPLSVSTRILSPAGAVVYEHPHQQNEALKENDGTYRYTAEVPLNALAPGEYVLRVAAGRGDAEAHRDVAFRVR
ncbi:MAG TPA: VWA domain-containing protein [Vicinamibacterales bacterium]|nr:VWA domain-containing protein [Vicinamibacterales bacterium]